MSGTRRLPATAVAVGGALLTAACGYHLQGTKSSSSVVPEHVKVIALVTFVNQTARPEIEQRVTEETARQLSSRGRYRVVTDRNQADALLEGAIIGFRTDPVQFNFEGRATRVQTVVSIQATLRDLSNDEILWSQTGLLFREQWDVPETAAGFFDQETLALDEIARGAASTLVNSMLEGF